MSSGLVQKYNVAGPRYTSYPTVPYWEEEQFTRKAWEASFIKSFTESNSKEGISLYIHLPYCEAMCTFCGCNKRITVNHAVELPYIKAVLKEWSLYLALVDEVPVISELHLGGGTPTFFSPQHLKLLIDGIFKHAMRSSDAAISFEGHPNNTTREHLQTLHDLGFNRVSYGVQDYNLEVQKAKRQQYEVGKQLLEDAGYVEIGMDHFALPTDELCIAMHNQQLHRNFMGYNASNTQLMVGLGVSSISDSWYGFAQNVKSITEYKKLLEQDIIPVYRGHLLTDEDLVIRKHILNLMCHFKTSWERNGNGYFNELPDVLIALKELEADGLLELHADKIIVPECGRGYVRNICMAFDLRLKRKRPETQLFSMTI